MPILDPAETVVANQNDTDAILGTLANLITTKSDPAPQHRETARAATVALLQANGNPSRRNLRRLCEVWFNPWRTSILPGILNDGDDVALATRLLKILAKRAWPIRLDSIHVRVVNGIPATECPSCGQSVNRLGDKEFCHTCGAAIVWPVVPFGEMTQPTAAGLLGALSELATSETDESVTRHVRHRQAAQAVIRAKENPSTANVRVAYLAWYDPRHERVHPFILSDPEAIHHADLILGHLRVLAWPDGFESEASEE